MTDLTGADQIILGMKITGKLPPAMSRRERKVDVKNARPNEADSLNQKRTILRLWIGALAPLVAWGLHSALVGVLASLPCTPALVYWLYGITALALLGVGFGAYISIRLLRLAKDAADGADIAVKRTRFFAITGVLLSALFAYAIVRDALVVAGHLIC